MRNFKKQILIKKQLVIALAILALFPIGQSFADVNCTTTELDLMCEEGQVLQGIDTVGQKHCVELGGGCASQKIGGCVLPSAFNGSTGGGCASGYSGECEYRCDKGTWTKVENNTCRFEGCEAKVIGTCNLPRASDGYRGGECSSGDVGYCEYECNKGSWTKVENNTCRFDGCEAKVIGTCSLPRASDGYSGGECPSGDTGYCEYKCNKGTWAKVENNTCH